MTGLQAEHCVSHVPQRHHTYFTLPSWTNLHIQSFFGRMYSSFGETALSDITYRTGAGMLQINISNNVVAHVLEVFRCRVSYERNLRVWKPLSRSRLEGYERICRATNFCLAFSNARFADRIHQELKQVV